MDRELNAVRMEMDTLGARADFPSESLEELNQLVGARDSIAKHLGEIRAEKDTALSRLAKAESDRQGLAAYAPLAAGFVHTPRLVVFGGGYPVIVEGTVVGAIGVSGGHYSHDMEVAKAALAAAGL